MPLVDTFAPLRRELDIYQQRALDTRQQAMDAPRQAQQMQLGNLQLQQGQQNLQIGQQTQQLNQIKMQDVQRKQQITQGLQQFMSENPDMPPTKARMTYLQDKDPQAAQATLKETISTATALAQFDPEAATNLINSELGTSYKYRGKDKGFIKVEDKVNGKIHFLDPQSLQAVKTMDIGVEERGPGSKEGKLRADLKAGLITQSDFDTAMDGAKTVTTEKALAEIGKADKEIARLSQVGGLDSQAVMGVLMGGGKLEDLQGAAQLSPEVKTAIESQAAIKQHYQKFLGGSAQVPPPVQPPGGQQANYQNEYNQLRQSGMSHEAVVAKMSGGQ
jgi:hypothetical protein